MDLIQDLLEDDCEKDSNKLLSLSAMIVIKTRTDELGDKNRHRFAYIFRNAAFLLENEEYVNKSLWDVFWGKKPNMKATIKGDENV